MYIKDITSNAVELESAGVYLDLFRYSALSLHQISLKIPNLKLKLTDFFECMKLRTLK